MISLNDYTSHDGLGLAELVARKEVTPDELAAAALEAGDEGESQNQRRVAYAAQGVRRRDSRRPSRGAFSGVPFMIKELVLHAKACAARWARGSCKASSLRLTLN